MDSPEKLSVIVMPATARTIREKVEDGSFASADELIRAALDALARETADKADDLAWVKARIRASVEDTRPGYSSEEIRQHLDDMLARAEGRHRDSAA